MLAIDDHGRNESAATLPDIAGASTTPSSQVPRSRVNCAKKAPASRFDRAGRTRRATDGACSISCSATTASDQRKRLTAISYRQKVGYPNWTSEARFLAISQCELGHLDAAAALAGLDVRERKEKDTVANCPRSWPGRSSQRGSRGRKKSVEQRSLPVGCSHYRGSSDRQDRRVLDLKDVAATVRAGCSPQYP